MRGFRLLIIGPSGIEIYERARIVVIKVTLIIGPSGIEIAQRDVDTPSAATSYNWTKWN